MNFEIYEHQREIFIRSQCPRFHGVTVNHMPVLDQDTPKHTDQEIQWDYLAHCNWAAMWLSRLHPISHLDVGSYAYFAACVGSFIPYFTFADIRPLPVPLQNVSMVPTDVTNLPMNDKWFNSVSCLHVLEHIGLGRYGDRLDVDGDVKALNELKRVLIPGGCLILVVPMNKVPRIDFNAHRIYNDKIIREMTGDLHLTDSAVFFDRMEVRDKEPDGDYTKCMLFQK